MRENLAQQSPEPAPAERPGGEPLLSMEQGMLGRLKDVLEKADPHYLDPVVKELERLHGAQAEKIQPLAPHERNEIISTLRIFLGMNEGEVSLRYPGGKTYILEKSGKGITIRLRGQAVDYKQALEEMEPLD